jgi:hypothetical protein
LFAKSPTQLRRQVEQRGKPKKTFPEPGPVDPSKRPLQESEGDTHAALDAAASWLAHTCPEPVEGWGRLA